MQRTGTLALKNQKESALKAEKNVVLKYAPTCNTIPQSILEKVSLGEQERFVKGKPYKGVDIYYLDSTSLNPSGTFKDPMICQMMAETIQQGIKRICVQSSGNTATSVLKYAAKTGIEVVLFYLKSNNYKLDPSLVPDNVFLIEVDGTEK